MWPLSGAEDGATFLPSAVDGLVYRSILALYLQGAALSSGSLSARLRVGSGLTALPSAVDCLVYRPVLALYLQGACLRD